MVQQQLFTECGLLRITEDGKSRLYSIPTDLTDDCSFEPHVLPFLSEPQTVLEVYPEANLIITQDSMFTLDGKIVQQNSKEKISISPVGDEWMIVRDSHQDNDLRFQITFWDGKAERDYIWGRYLLKDDKYLAIFTSGDHRWLVYQYDGTLVLDIADADAEMMICGDFFVTHGIGSHAIYSLKKQDSPLAEQHCVFRRQQLVMCSTHEDFALCANLQGQVQTCYRGQYRDLGKAEMVDLYDRADLFIIKRNGRYFLYRLDGTEFAQNICPFGADMAAYNPDENSLLIDTNGVFHLMRF